MTKLSKSQQKRINDLKERNESIEKIVVPAIEDPIQLIPLNLIVEAQVNSNVQTGIKLEAEIFELKLLTQDEDVLRQIRLKSRRMERTKGRLEALEAFAEMLDYYSHYGREFTIVPK